LDATWPLMTRIHMLWQTLPVGLAFWYMPPLALLNSVSAGALAPAKAEAKPAPQAGPAAQKLLAETGLDPAKVQGTGKDGRITKGDVIAAGEVKTTPVAPATPAVPAAPTPAPPPASGLMAKSTAGYSRKRMSPIRQRIAQRLVQAQRTAAILTTFNEVDMAPAMALRKKWKETFEKQHGVGLGFMSIFATAVVAALRKYPLVNSQIDGTDVVTPDGIHLGVAVGTERGLVVPVLRNAQDLGFADIEKAIKAAAGKARDGKLSLDDMQGGTFTITNGGVYGSLMSTPILNPPQSGILGMHTIKERPIAVDGQVVIRPMMYIALSYDHRIVDGAEAVGFLVRVKELVEAPERMLLGL
jgi:2-oxoglutarate dehydrogenase E2 component (dihydrolipoamide succinyltransferase)